MPKPTKGPRIGGSPAHQRIILANLASQLFEHGKITTTLTRAKRVQPLAEHLITKAKRGDVAARRIVAKTIHDPIVLRILFDQVAPSVAGRDGGYTRVTRLGTRQGDGAPMAQIEIIAEAIAEAAVKPAAKAAPKKDEAVDADILAAQQALAEADKAAEELKAEDEPGAPEDEATEEATDKSDDEK